MKKISMIIPIYNTAEYLRECLQSVINQTYKCLEIILINDGSTDHSDEVINEFLDKDERILYIQLDRRRGVGYARNAGLKKATGDYVYFLDSDDFLAENTIEILVDFIGEEPIIAGKKKVIHKFEDSIVKNNSEINEAEMNEAGYMPDDVVVKYRKVKGHFRDLSILRRLISKQLIDTLHLRFSEEVECYSDLAFISPIIGHMKKGPTVTNAYYFKRVRNNPITNPSIMQRARGEKVTDFLKIYTVLRQKYVDEPRVTSFLDGRFIKSYRKNIILLLANQENIPLYYENLAKAADQLNEKRIKKLNVVVRKELDSLRNRKLKSFKRMIWLHHHLRELKRAYKSRKKMKIYLYKHVLTKKPVNERKIVFESFLGKNYSDSPKYIYEYLLNSQKDYQYIWIFNKTGKDIPGNPKQVKRFSLAYYYHLATAKYWVSNARLPLHMKKREETVYLQTWHGTPLKKLANDMDEVSMPGTNTVKYKRNFTREARKWDYLVSPNAYSTEIFRRAFQFENKMLDVGYPRNDLLYTHNNEQYIATLKDKLHIPLNKKVILYAPTWRDDEFYEKGKYKFNLRLDLMKMKELLGDEYVVALRLHYLIAENISTEGLEGFVYNLSDYDDITELYLISDILITDYSSVFFDYANLKRPILFYTYDLEKYRDTLRGFYINMETEVPGPLLKTTDDIIQSIQHIDQIEEEFKDKYDTFYGRFCDWDDGKASKKVVDSVFNSDKI